MIWGITINLSIVVFVHKVLFTEFHRIMDLTMIKFGYTMLVVVLERRKM